LPEWPRCESRTVTGQTQVRHQSSVVAPSLPLALAVRSTSTSCRSYNGPLMRIGRMSSRMLRIV